MRIVLVGRLKDRQRLRQALAGTSLDVIDEADSIASARRNGADVDAFLVAPDVTPSGQAASFTEALTAREIDVLELLAEGLPNKAIASRLNISDQTVKFHVASICGKLGAANRTEAVRVAIRRGLVSI